VRERGGRGERERERERERGKGSIWTERAALLNRTIRSFFDSSFFSPLVLSLRGASNGRVLASVNEFLT